MITLNRNVSDKEKFAWNTIGGLANAISSVLLSVSVNRVLGTQEAGFFAFAYSNAQMMMTIGNFEMRPYQSTDVKEKYSFNTYFTFKLLSCALMLVVSVLYIFFGEFSAEKTAILFLTVWFRLVETFTDVIAGRYQQLDRIDLAGKIFSIRVFWSTLAFIVTVYVTKDLVWGCIMLALTTTALFPIYDRRYFIKNDVLSFRLEFRKIFSLAVEILPLFIGAFIMMYISNAPKYAMNSFAGDEVQNIYNIIFMPTFVINLFSIFVFRPMLVKMSMKWAEGDLKGLRKSIFVISFIILVLSCIALVGTFLLGVPILSLIYNIDLNPYKWMLMFAMVSGGLCAFVVFMQNLMTVIRAQRYVLLGYGLAGMFAFIVSKPLVKGFGIWGALWEYNISLVIISSIFMIVVIWRMRKRIREENE